MKVAGAEQDLFEQETGSRGHRTPKTMTPGMGLNIQPNQLAMDFGTACGMMFLMVQVSKVASSIPVLASKLYQEGLPGEKA